jgi:hypothetical protein
MQLEIGVIMELLLIKPKPSRPKKLNSNAGYLVLANILTDICMQWHIIM